MEQEDVALVARSGRTPLPLHRALHLLAHRLAVGLSRPSV